jgi:L-asparagine permease
MNAAGVPYTGILLTGTVTLLGVGLNAVVPDKAFEIVLNGAAFGTLVCWGMLALCQLKLARWSKQGIAQRPATFRMPGSPYTSYLVLVFLVGVFVLIAFDYPVGTWTVASLAVFIPLLVAGWFACRNRILAIAEERLGFTGELPVLAKRPLAASKESGPTEKMTDPESTD